MLPGIEAGTRVHGTEIQYIIQAFSRCTEGVSLTGDRDITVNQAANGVE